MIQVGTEQDSTGEKGRYFAGYEMLPNNLVTIDGLPVSSGDTMVASLNLVYSDVNVWNIQIRDISNGKSFNLNVNYNSTLSSGEWIVERPLVSG